MEISTIENHPYYVAVQYHPEYLSRPLSPSPPFMGLVLASVGKLNSYLSKGCRLSPRSQSDASSDEEEIKINDLKISNGVGEPKVNGISKDVILENGH